MTEIDCIRSLYYEKGLSKSAIHKDTGFDLHTIRKYLNQEDFNVKNVTHKPKVSKLSPYYETIDSWLEQDKKFRKKQRHTSKRVHSRLKEEYPDFNVSYRTVALYCKSKKKEIWTSNGFLPLEHPMGEAQVDFGRTEYFQNGKNIYGYHLVMSFPFSNASYTLLFPGETSECLLEGMQQIFNYIGGVPSTIRFDNASSMVVKVKKGGNRDLTETFINFKHHYNFTASFCNPASGHEKGHVENKVGYLRRNIFVPAPIFNDIEVFNKKLLKICDEDMERIHYKRNKYISYLFKLEKAEFLPLPRSEFEVCRYDTVKADAYGKIKLEKGKRIYSTSPSMAGNQVTAKQTAFYVSILDKDGKTIVRHNRLYGKETESMLWLPYLQQLSRRPGALKYTKIYEMLPDKLQQHAKKSSKSDCGEMLKAIATLTCNASFEEALVAVSDAIEHDNVNADSIILAYNRNKTLPMPEIQNHLQKGLPNLPDVSSSCSDYDFITGGKDNV